MDEIVKNDDNVLAIKTTPDIELAEVIGSQGFLPGLRFHSAMSDAAKEGTVGVNTFGIVENNEIEDLGQSVEVLPIAYRHTAISKDNDEVSVSHDYASAEFTRIRENSESADQETRNGNLWGPEFLVWIPDVGKFATFLFGSKSARFEAPKMDKCRKSGTGCVLKPRKIVGKKHTWFIAGVHEISTLTGDAPDRESLSEVVSNFMNPKSPAVEKEAEVEDERG